MLRKPGSDCIKKVHGVGNRNSKFASIRNTRRLSDGYNNKVLYNQLFGIQPLALFIRMRTKYGNYKVVIQ